MAVPRLTSKLPALATLLLLATVTTRASAQAITVSVRDTSGLPLPFVNLEILDHANLVVATARTGTQGVAHMPRADTTIFAVRARRFGFSPQRTIYMRVGTGDTLAVKITMVPVPAMLNPVIVTAQRDSVRRSTLFGINLRATGGHVITPAEIEYSSVGARDLADVLARRALPGMRVDPVRRCLVSTRGGGCLPFVIDGQLFRDGSALQDVALPEMIDYIVILRGSEVGVRYGSVGYNGILLIATRLSGRR